MQEGIDLKSIVLDLIHSGVVCGEQCGGDPASLGTFTD